MGILQDKVILVAGLANEKSLAWGTSQSIVREGGQLVISCQEALLGRVEPLAAKAGDAPVFVCNVNSDEEIAKMADGIRERFGRLDGIVHSIAFAPREALKKPFVETTREEFQIALETSAHSLNALVAGLLPLMENGGSVVTFTFDTYHAYPNYNVMGVAKAALEAEVRYLAFNLGERKIRVNAVSAGPPNTLAARGISGFSSMKQDSVERAPLGWDPDDTGPVGDATAYLLSDLSRAVTGTVHYVDGGTHISGV
ncbi:MAG: SDR family oxidoreductase [Armatimonadetes bacterium]|nr:SDR family oxidoreductase [Armatimonadota bacterium]